MDTTNPFELKDKLPAECAVWHDVEERWVLVLRFKDGYLDFEKEVSSTYYTKDGKFDGELFNRENGITQAQVKAMKAGSMFGWDVPRADPDVWEQDSMRDSVPWKV